ncbi:phage protein [Microbulbifer sp. GL-2]|uniref:phage protein n=1 Tax=Microbulbifer sp. GL-2 TaxID=2591606 RepID=UPI001163CBA4|nr:phage protein [Microbulbifer sp. GL-2]BBM04172.1 tail protein [Microbulbifer sp. GL-2]
MSKLSGRDVDAMIGSYRVNFDEASISIEDGTGATKTRGIPDGFLPGDVAASGEIKLNTGQFNIILQAAKEAGSFRGLPTFDLVFNAESSDEKLNIEAFDCKLSVTDLLNATQGNERLMHTITFEVTGREFVKVNGVSYLRPEEIERLN